MKHGSRRNYNYTSPKFLELSDRIVTALAKHYKGNDPVFAWQLDNEFNCHMAVSYAPSDTIAFRAWLKERYRTLDALNTAWGTRFWSQTYSDWEQIDLPHPTATYLNPSVLLDESRFISDTVVRFARRQADILRKANPKWLITHNGLFPNIDGPALAEVLDFFSHDQYPLFNAEGDWPGYAQQLAQARSLSFPCGILEQQSGPGGQMDYLHRTPKPGEMRLWSWQSIAHGAKLLGYFRWRTCPYGSEQHWHGLIDADDRDNRRLAEAVQVGHELKQLPGEFFDAPVVKTVAILRDFDNEVNDSRINTYIKSGAGEFARWYSAVSRRHIPVDMVWSDSDWSEYQVLIAPHPKMIDEPALAKLDIFFRSGGTLILGAQSGSKDRNCHLVERTPPGLLREVAGVEVEDWTTLPIDQVREAQFVEGGTIALRTFVERVKLRGAATLARWRGEDAILGDAPAITVNTFGHGRVIYVGGYCDAAAAGQVIETLGLTPLIKAPQEVELVARQMNGGVALAVLNHSPIKHRIAGLQRGCKDLITGKKVSGTTFDLPGYGVAILHAK
jgi:beta-galactosidase